VASQKGLGCIELFVSCVDGAVKYETTKPCGSLTHGAERFLRSCQLCSYTRTSQNFMELEGLLPCSQELSTGPYPEPDQSNPCHPIIYL
jgi:hypothetical protein